MAVLWTRTAFGLSSRTQWTNGFVAFPSLDVSDLWNISKRSRQMNVNYVKSLHGLLPKRYQQQQQQQFRGMASAKRWVGSDPLDVLRKESAARNLCDDEGFRRGDAHWVCSIAISPLDISKPPNLRTVGIKRISPAGIDFVMKRSSPVAERIATGHPISFLNTEGQYAPGQTAEQWRGEGHCKTLALATIVNYIPSYTVSSMVGSARLGRERKRMQAEAKPANGSDTSTAIHDRLAMHDKSHFTEIMQATLREIENGQISMEELDQCIRAFRLVPDRMECMIGGPDVNIMWERWEWMRNTSSDGPEGSISWEDATLLVPH